MSRSLQIGALGLAFFALSAVFIALGFPYDLLARRFTTQLEAAIGAEVAFATLEPRLTLAGPAFEATDLRVTMSDGTKLQADRALARPAWSFSWLTLTPALYVDVESAVGDVAGVVTGGSEPDFDLTLGQIDLARLPTDAGWPGLRLSGRADADVDVRLGEELAEGRATIYVGEGSLRTPDLPIPLAWDELDGELVFGDGSFAEVKSLEATGPLLSAQLTGTVGEARSFAQAPLDLELQYEVDPKMRSTLQSAGLQTNRQGQGQLRIRGTPTSPMVR
ncbi:MAG: type II secretion system protein GspN [Myxococcota bacterium]|nr:type II secretion system protein GspN [Myxococcota bacterium]